jgi:hypothetical protein
MIASYSGLQNWTDPKIAWNHSGVWSLPVIVQQSYMPVGLGRDVLSVSL